jgi:hypothetical protein
MYETNPTVADLAIIVSLMERRCGKYRSEGWIVGFELKRPAY